MSDTTDRIKARIAKLLALAEGEGAAPGEVANAMAFAAALMEEHHITADDARQAHAAAGRAEAVEFGKDHAWTDGARLSAWESSLMHEVMSLTGTKCYYSQPTTVRTAVGTVAYDEKGQPRTARPVTFYGEAGDVADAVALFNEWRATIAAMARLRWGGALRGDGAAYAEGFVSGMRQARRDRANAPNTTALAVRSAAIVKAKQDAASQWLTTQGVRLGSARSHTGSRNASSEARAQGRADGANATMTRRGRVTGGTGGGRALPA